jgi:hypothetical protein
LRDATDEVLDLLPIERRDHRAGYRQIVDLPYEVGVLVREEGGDRLRELPVRARLRPDGRREARGKKRQRPIAPPLQPSGARERFTLHAEVAAGRPASIQLSSA